MIVAIGSSSFGQTSNKAVDLLKKNGFEIRLNPYGRKMTKNEIIQHLKGADYLLAGLEPLDEEVFKQSPNLKFISRIGIGLDNVDLSAAEKYHISVSNTPDAPTEAVAEMTLTALLAIEHRIIESNKEIHSGLWKKHTGHSLSELTIFFIGYGRIGRRFSEYLKPFNSNILIYDKYNPSVSNCTMKEGLEQADVITIHASGSDLILGVDEFKTMKDGMVILNSARGNLVDESLLFESLKNGKVSYYWGDAHWVEPYNGKLCSLDNAILTPHICTYTQKCREEMELQAVNNLLKYLNDNCN